MSEAAAKVNSDTSHLSLSRKVESDAFHYAVAEHVGREAFGALEKTWNRALARGPRDEPFFRHEYQRLWLEAFAPSAQPLAYTVTAGGETRLAAAFVRRTERVLGVPLDTLALPAGDHSNRAGFALGPGDPAPALEALWRKVRSEKWHLLLLRDLPEGAPELVHLERLAAADGFPTGTWVSLRSPFVSLARFAGAGDAATRVDSALDAHFRQNLRRRRRKLATHGEVTFERFDATTPAAQLDALLEEALRLEASGWKGRAGTAIACQPSTTGFYASLARWALREKALALSFLKVGGRRVAFHFGLVYGGKYCVPKCGFDETFAECSPGQLLARDVLADCVARDLTEFDFLGPAMEWKLEWTSQARPHRWLYVFRPGPLGRALAEAKFTVAPLIKGALGRK